MKYILVIFLSFFSFFSYSQDNKEAAQIKIEPDVYDFGTIKEEDGVVIAKFKITNISKKPYIMNYSYSGCGCVSSKITKEPLMMGKSRIVEVQFNPRRRPGVFNKEVMLVSNNKHRGDMLKVRGEVIPRRKSVDEIYPIKTIDGLLLSEEDFVFGILSQNEKHTGVINFFNGSKSALKIEVKTEGDALGTVRLSTTVVEPNREGQIQFSYDLRNNKRFGELKNRVELFVNGVKWEKSISAQALVVFNFFEMSDGERKLAPRAVIAPTNYSVRMGERVDIPILNNGKSDLKILSVIKNGVTCDLSKEIIPAGSEGRMTVQLTENKGGSVTLLFNSPDTPIVVINLKIK